MPTVLPYTGYGGTGWSRILARVVLRRRGDVVERVRSVRGWRSFTSIPVGDIAVVIETDTATVTARTDRGGVLDASVDLRLPPGWNRIRLRIGDDDAVEMPVFVVDEAVGFGLVSDIDDTVMVTALPRPFLAAWNTFVLDEHARAPVPGMAVLYERITRSHPGAPVVYLSTGAWNVAPTLTRFLHRNLYPRGPLLLTDWGPTHTRWFRSGQEHKRLNLRRLAAEFPTMSWLLVGDDGQHDEQLYGDFAREQPDRVAAIAIRQLTTSEAVLAGGRSSTGDSAPREVPWIYAPDGAGLSSQLRDLGLLDPQA